MGQQLNTSLISELWAVLTAAVVGLFSLGVFRAKVATKADLKLVEDAQTALLRKSLYKDDGTSVYVPRAECDKMQTGCSDRILEKLEKLEIDSQRRHEEHMQLHRGLPEFVGSVTEFMHQHRRKGD